VKRSEPKIGWIVGRSGAVNGRCRKTMERSGVWSGRSRSRELWLQKYGRLKRGAAFSPLMLCSHEIAYGTGMWFLPRCMKGRHGLAMRILSVRPSVKRRIKICLDFHTIRKII